MEVKFGLFSCDSHAQLDRAGARIERVLAAERPAARMSSSVSWKLIATTVPFALSVRNRNRI